MHSVFKISFLAGVLGLFTSGQVFAHAHLASATPAMDSKVAASPAELDLKFSEVINLKFSGVKVIGADKAIVATGAATRAAGDESTLVVPVSAPLAPGAYTVDWHVLSKDGHKTQGSYTFTVKP